MCCSYERRVEPKCGNTLEADGIKKKKKQQQESMKTKSDAKRQKHKVATKELKQSANVQINENTRNIKLVHTVRSEGEMLE